MSLGWKRAAPWATAALVFLISIAVSATAGTERLHPTLRAWASASSARLSPSGAGVARLPLPGGDGPFVAPLPELILRFLGDLERVPVLVKAVRPVGGMHFAGLPIRANTGTIVSVAVTLGELLRLAEDDGVVYIEPAWKAAPKLDVSLSTIGMPYVRSAYPGLTGEGVVVGVVDTGIDYLHLDFRYDDDGDEFEESSRITAIWDQTEGLFGTYYSRAEIEADIALELGPQSGVVRQHDNEGHGSRVAGILVSDGSSSTAGIAGIAPGAELIVVKTPFYTTDILAGVEYIFEEAGLRGLPAVVNLSLGGHAGPHDGTSLFEQGLDELVDRPGRVIVVSAGNEGDQSIHISRVLFGNSTSFAISPSSASVEASLWYPGSAHFDVTVALPGGLLLEVPFGETGSASTENGDLYVDNAAAGANPSNGFHEATLRLSGAGGGQLWGVSVTDRAGGGRFHGWITSGEAEFIGGDATHTIAEPGNALRVITVGSYNSRASWPSLAGTQDFTSSYPLGALTSFSSAGPTMDGRQKPDLTAPGAWILSSRSGSAWVQNYVVHTDGVHEASLGTSFAAPHVAGVAALMLSIDPTMTWTEVRDILIDSAGQDAHTASPPDSRWGYGKLSAPAAVNAVEPSPGDGGDGDGPGPLGRVRIETTTNPATEIASFVYQLPERATWAVLRIYSVTGRLLYETALDPGGERVDWGLTTANGLRAASGLYLFLVVSDAGRSPVERLVIRR
ncbi:MAG: S8 family serine peptidase [Candidatus Bipolaricaulota bacterium]|nr:MAG: S8 family serine peptidase [Candidatus Bipolaricaulota bacterium]